MKLPVDRESNFFYEVMRKKYRACFKDCSLSLILCFKPNAYHALTTGTMGTHFLLFLFRFWRNIRITRYWGGR
jgi:hypothetical protein